MPTTPNQDLWNGLDSKADVIAALAKGADVSYTVHKPDSWSHHGWIGWSMLQYSVYRANSDVIAVLLAHGANPNDLIGNHRMLAYLLLNGPSNSESDKYTKSATTLINNTDNQLYPLDLKDTIQISNSIHSYLVCATYWNYPDVVHALLRQQSPYAQADSKITILGQYHDWPLISYTVKRGYTASTIKLLNARATVAGLTIPNDPQHRSLLAFAIDQGYGDMAAALFQGGARLTGPELLRFPNWQTIHAIAAAAPAPAAAPALVPAPAAPVAAGAGAAAAGRDVFVEVKAVAGHRDARVVRPPSAAPERSVRESELETENKELTRKLNARESEVHALRIRNEQLAEDVKRARELGPRIKEITKELIELREDNNKKDRRIAELLKEVGQIDKDFDPNPQSKSASILMRSISKVTESKAIDPMKTQAGATLSHDKPSVIPARRRIGLFEFSGHRVKNKAVDEKATQLLSGHLAAIGRVVGSAYSEGDCFFDSFAQELEKLNIKVPWPDEKHLSSPTHKNLRQLCDKIVKNLDRSKRENWIKTAVEKDSGSYQDYLATIQFTAPEMKAYEGQGLFNGIAIWGRSHIEGRLLCQALGLHLHLIEMITVDNQPIMSHQLIDGQNSTQLDEETARSTYTDNKIIHLIVYQGSLHFVPTTQPKLSPY